MKLLLPRAAIGEGGWRSASAEGGNRGRGLAIRPYGHPGDGVWPPESRCQAIGGYARHTIATRVPIHRSLA